ncbi:type III secretion system effector XopK [Xanthomonas arboricola pv. juglandis]|nr:type III secretion system effector XopK [Xanthomonas arboricola]MDN0220190.1 type III secretion system effector XopK [Xanthomonas arboricola pv. juglandis]MDN0223433.1 type III secretion system effector XopK [Xanthomonas arboricola pv. juglandis]MDN0227407.1 type III secretion system effector XopK [Xanthomonas arboricola pv. juglandis]MDN0232969.1 type III secretion system effector XopK [Xanthomonas arboricola pv. juglandis]MDN0235908.1 type III secretion system effector XopK [Xanthomonas a
MRIQQHANSSARSFDSSTPDALASAKDLPAAGGWPMGLESLKRKASQRKPVSGHASKHKAGENAMAEIQEAEAVYDAFVVAKYLADPLHGTVDNTAELIAEMPNSGEPEHSPEADQPAHSHEHTPIDHTPVSAEHQTQHGIGADHSLDPHPIEPAAHESLLHTLAEEGAPEGVADLAMSLSISGAMLPLSGLAIYAAYKETREVTEQRGALRQRKRQLQSERALLQTALESGPFTAVAGAQIDALSEAIDTVAYQQQRNARDGAIAVTSMASASVIFTKATTELGIQGGLALGANNANAAGLIGHSTAAAGVASAAGIAGTFVLAPLASVAATALGGTFLHQSRKEKTRVVADVARVEDFMQRLEPGELSPGAQRYQHFLSTKLTQRSGFAGSFNNWNKGFVVGGVTYTASTLTKTGVSAAVVLGAATVTGPVGAGLVVGAGLLGAVTMGVGGHQFLLAHGKQKRYRNYETAEMPSVDRALLAMADLLPTPEAGVAASPGEVDPHGTPRVSDGASGKASDTVVTTGTGDQLESDHVMPGSTEHTVAAQSVAAKQASPAADDASAATEATAAVAQHGFELRSALYACIDGQEKARDALLQSCANDMKKRYRAAPRSTDQRPATGQAAQPSSLAKRARAALFAGATYGRAVLTGKPRVAGEKAARSYAKHTDTLTETALNQWLQTPGSVKSQVAYMQSCLELQKKYLDSKLRLRVELPAEDAASGAIPDTEATATTAAQAHARLTTQLHQARERDEFQLRSISLMLEELGMANEELESSDMRKIQRAENRMQGLQQRLIGALTANAITPQPGSAGFAHFCMKQARRHTSDVRGTLLATEMQAARIREGAAAAAMPSFSP